MLVLLPLVGAWLMMPPDLTEATQCVVELPYLFEEADLAFEGKVISTKQFRVYPPKDHLTYRVDFEGQPTGRDVTETQFALKTIWKGPLDRTATVYSYTDEEWGAWFNEGDTDTVFAFHFEDEELNPWTFWCAAFSASHLREHYPEQLEYLGRGFPMELIYMLIGVSSAGLLSGMLWLGWRTRRVGAKHSQAIQSPL